MKQYDLVYVPQKAVKGQALTDFSANHPIPDAWELNDNLPGEDMLFVDILPPWKMYFDEDARHVGASAGVVFVSKKKRILTYSFTLT